jgi:phosphate transport system substrate-binding protein
VAGDVDGIGYFGYAYYAANKDKLRAAPIQAGPDAQPVTPGPETILDQSYKPLSRPLFLYAKNSAMKRPEVAHFLRYYIENVNELTTKGGYVPPHADDQEANLKALPPAAESAAAK